MNEKLVVSLKYPQAAARGESASSQTPRTEESRKRRIPWRLIGALGVCVMCGGALFYAYQQGWFSRTTPPLPTSSTAESLPQDARDIIEEIGMLIVLPEGEEPTVATVTDPAALVEQPFFKNAKVGDRVLLYTQAKKAFLYDPSARRLVEVAPITTEPQ